MVCIDRDGNVINENKKQNTILKLLYNNFLGRKVVSFLVRPEISKIGGFLLNTRMSARLIPSFVRNNSINMDEYEEQKYYSYNDFFTRKIKEGKRIFSSDPKVLCSPCDSRLSVYKIDNDSSFKIKDTEYTMESLFKSKKIAKYYKDGILMVFRLCVDDYHHYAYVDEGIKSKNYRIKGVFHTVNPIANDKYQIYKENTREFSVLKSRNFGNIMMMEVGALMVGRIKNHHGKRYVKRGQEKGYFEFGGSTVILCFKKDSVKVDKDILFNTSVCIETKVKLGEKIGEALN